MDKKQLIYDKHKSRVIVNVLDFFETKEEIFKLTAIKELKLLADYFKIPIKKNKNINNLKHHLREFILNEKGYSITLINLYNSLLNAKQ